MGADMGLGSWNSVVDRARYIAHHYLFDWYYFALPFAIMTQSGSYKRWPYAGTVAEQSCGCACNVIIKSAAQHNLLFFLVLSVYVRKNLRRNTIWRRWRRHRWPDLRNLCGPLSLTAWRHCNQYPNHLNRFVLIHDFAIYLAHMLQTKGLQHDQRHIHRQ